MFTIDTDPTFPYTCCACVKSHLFLTCVKIQLCSIYVPFSLPINSVLVSVSAALNFLSIFTCLSMYLSVSVYDIKLGSDSLFLCFFRWKDDIQCIRGVWNSWEWKSYIFDATSYAVQCLGAFRERFGSSWLKLKTSLMKVQGLFFK